MIVRLYASRYPGEVAGLVLIDSSHEEQLKRFAALPPPPAPAPASAATAAPSGPREQIDLEGMSAELAKEAWHGNIPLVVLTRSKTRPGSAPSTADDPRLQIWQELQRELATRSPHAEHIVAPNSGHYIHNDEPQLVVDAVHRVTNQATR
jgi:pimeloyl-ACP methyl ester carboxylesterase